MPALLQRRVVWPGFLASLAALVAAFPLQAADPEPVIVHEWGTFTSLQDDDGRPIGGINVDDEPVPYFVKHALGPAVAPQYAQSEGDLGLPPYELTKGWVQGDPAVTLRLETPVIYIYPPKGKKPHDVPPLTVHVQFNGGALTEFYPAAKADGVHLIDQAFPIPEPLTENTTSSLTWNDVRLGSSGLPIETSEPVWTIPRETSAPLLQVSATNYSPNGLTTPMSETEHFLFYRGVGHLYSPVTIWHPTGPASRQISMWHLKRIADYGFPRGGRFQWGFGHGWLTEIRQDGTCAFREVPSEITLTTLEEMATFRGSFPPSEPFPGDFSKADFRTDNLPKLELAMKQALVKEGLFPDEASAMLRTWDLSYFKSPGLRFFYTVPREWVEKTLPLTVTGAPARITRVMIGRIELISPSERTALARLDLTNLQDHVAITKKAAQNALASDQFSQAEKAAFYRGEKPLNDLGIAIPSDVADYLSLGRFRDALVAWEQSKRPVRPVNTVRLHLDDLR